MARAWQANPTASFARRIGSSECKDGRTCLDIWELDNGDVAVIGEDLTVDYAKTLPVGVNMGEGERLVVIPGSLFRSARVGEPHA